MYIQCFIKKSDGSAVFVDFEGIRYIFAKNQVDDAVCFVGNQGHQRRLLAMGPSSYAEYIPPDVKDSSFQPGAQGVPLGTAQRQPPKKDEPLPDAITVDEGLALADETDSAEVALPVEVEWAQEAIDQKIKEFRYLDTENFKSFVEANRDRIMGWPIVVRAEVAKKLSKKLPDLDPGIEGFAIDDYIGSGNTVDP